MSKNYTKEQFHIHFNSLNSSSQYSLKFGKSIVLKILLNILYKEIRLIILYIRSN